MSALRSLQWKLVLIYLLLILLATELIGFYLLRSLEQYYLSSFSTSLASQAQLTAGFVSRYLGERQDREALQSLVGDWSRQVGADITIVDAQGAVLGSSRPGLYGPGAVLNLPEVKQALAGARGEALGKDPQGGERRLHLAVPIRSSGRLAGAVYLSAPLERIYLLLGDIRVILLTASGLALLVTAVAGYMLARTITGPIREITSRAAEMAAGRFDQKIAIRSDDEIGQLAAMFNYLTLRLKDTLDEISAEKSRVEAILRHMTDGLIALDGRDRVLLMNPAAAALTGLDPQQATGKRLDELLPEPDLTGQARQALAEGRTLAAEASLSGPPRRLLHVDAAPLRIAPGRTPGVVLVLRDITEQDRLERMRRDFVANVSHELKTPITTIKSYVETLLDGAAEDPAVTARFLQVVEVEANRMSRLVSDLLQLAQLENENQLLDVGPVDLAAVVAAAVGKLHMQADRKQVRIVQDWPDDLPPALGDPDKIVQVLLNVMTNAIDFTPPGGSVRVSLTQLPEWLEVRVTDTGIGIPAEDLPHLFDRFYRVDKARTRELGGTGLGLSIARQIVRAHGGDIQIESREGCGTVVTFTLPRASGWEEAS